MKMKKKLFIPLIAALLTIGLTSVGFAAWVITGETKDTADSQLAKARSLFTRLRVRPSCWIPL